MKASAYIAEFLHAQGVDVVFEVVGGMITHLLDSIHQQGKIRVVSMHHEQGAAFAVDGFGRMRNRPTVALATSGPGATNLLTGIGSCHFDSVPAVFITGQVNRHELKRGRGVRQLGFQETDIVAMARPITKAAWLVEDADDLPRLLEEAFRLSTEGRPGPVLLDVPMDVQRLDVQAKAERLPPPPLEAGALPEHLWTSLQAAERPLIIAGSGASQVGIRAPLRDLVGRIGVPVVCSLLGNDFLESGHPLRVGFYGSYGNRWANFAVGRADWVLVLGSRLDIRQTGADTDSFVKDKLFYHVDVDESEINNRIRGCHSIPMELKTFLAAAEQTCPPLSLEIEDWKREIEENRRKWPPQEEYRSDRGINPCAFLEALSARDEASSAYVADVGQHQMWAAQSLVLAEGQRFLTSGGMGAMGYGLPASIGASLAVRGKPVVLIAGDGGFQLNLQELQTVVRNRLPLKLIILHNHCHGMVRQFQQSYFHSRYHSTMWGYDAPDFEKVAKAYGMDALTLSDPAALPAALDFVWRDPAQPVLLQVMLDPEGNVYPKIAFGHPLTEMEPDFQPLEMEGT